MHEHLRKILTSIENAPLTLGTWVVTFLALIFGRIAIDNFFGGYRFQFSDHFFYEFTHHFFTFLFIFLLALTIVRFTNHLTFKNAAAFLTFGFFVIWLPPIIDDVISHGRGFWSFYTFDSLPGLLSRYLTFFGDKPDIGITYGIRVEVAIATLAFMTYTWIKSQKIFRMLFTGLLIYTALFFVGAFPSLITIALQGPSQGFLSVTDHNIATLMLSPDPLFGLDPPDLASSLNVKMSLVWASMDILFIMGILFIFFRSYFLALWHNVRFPQMVYHAGLFILGALLALFYTRGDYVLDLFHLLGFILLIAAVECAWLASVVINDLHDIKIDTLTNPARPIVASAIPLPLYKTFGFLFSTGSLLLAALVSTQVALLLVVYQALAWMYSAWPLRLKRFPGIATFFAGLASLMVFFAGYIVFSADKNITSLPLQIPAFLLVAYALTLPIKDFKDIEGDRADGVYTLPVLLGEVWSKRLIGTTLFSLFVGSVFLLHVPKLFPLGLFFGSLGYWILQVSGPAHRSFTYRSLTSWFVALATGYGFFLFLTLVGSV